MGWLLLAAVVVALWALPCLLFGRFIGWVFDQVTKPRRVLPQPVVHELPTEMQGEGGIGERKRRIITLPDSAGRYQARK